MKYTELSVLKPITYKFEGEREGWEWYIKPVTMGAEIQMSIFMNTAAATGIPRSALEIAVKEIALTYAGHKVDGLDLAQDAAEEEVINTLLGMPADIVMEIWKAVGAACPPWGPVIPDAPEAGEEGKKNE